MTDRSPYSVHWGALVIVAAALYLAASCGGSQDPATGGSEAAGGSPDTPELVAESPEQVAGTPELLSEWRQLQVEGGQLVLGRGVVPYTLNSALFSDYARKLRTVWLPDGSEPAVYHPDDVFDFPVGTVITKTFYFPLAEADGSDDTRVLKVATAPDALTGLDLAAVRLLETRVLVRRDEGWVALPYVWNAGQTDAALQRTGDLMSLVLVDDATETPFPYVVPDVNQCSSCHATNHSTGAIQPIGLKARHLNTEVDLGDGVVSQLELWQTRGLLGPIADSADLPRAAVWYDDAASLDDRARAYLDINCAHCHNQVGSADTSGLFLEPWTEVGPELGVCKPPIAAGRGTGGRLVGIHPGDPDASIFVYRMETSDPGAMMPELGRALTHREGVDLIAAWIESLDGSC